MKRPRADSPMALSGKIFRAAVLNDIVPIYQVATGTVQGAVLPNPYEANSARFKWT